MNWDDVRLFLAVAEGGSFRQASLKMNIGHTTLSRRIEALEDTLGTKLFVRQSTGLKLTPAGEEMLQTAVPMRDEFSGLQARLFGEEQDVPGTIKLTVPYVLLNHFLMPSLKDFCNEWPEIRFDIDTSLNLIDLRAREADLAIRMTNNPGDFYIGRQLGQFCEAVYASPNYLKEFSDESRSQHHWIHPGGGYEFVASLDRDWVVNEPPEIRVVLPDVVAQMQAAEFGMGIATIPCIMGDGNPNLKRISTAYVRTGIWLLAHPDTRGNRRMQLCREFIVDTFEKNQALLDGECG